MDPCALGSRGITVGGPMSIAQGSYGPSSHSYGLQWPKVPQNPPYKSEPDPDTVCPEACASELTCSMLSRTPPPSPPPPCPVCDVPPCRPDPCQPPVCNPDQPPCRAPSPTPVPSPAPVSPAPESMSQPFPPPPLGPRMLRCHHPSVPSLTPSPCHGPCSLPFKRPCVRVPPICLSTLTSPAMKTCLTPYEHMATIYQLDYGSAPGVRRKQLFPCPKRNAPLGCSAGIITTYYGKCGGGPRKPPPRRIYGIMGPPPCKYRFGCSEYQAKVGRLGGQLLRCHAKRASCKAYVTPYGTAPPCRPPVHPPCAPPCAPPPPKHCTKRHPCPPAVYLGPCRPGKDVRLSKKCYVC